ncbi:MAG: hypothetical protein AAF636_07105 [Pseudomonadota bacterium]
MAHAEFKTRTINEPGLLKGVLLWVWDALVYLGENSARARVIHQINGMSDEELRARGLSRADLVKRVMSDGYHL